MDCDTKDLSSFESDFVSNFDTYKADGGFCAVIPTKICLIDILSDIEILEGGSTLFLKDIVIYPRGEKSFKGEATKEMISLIRQISRAAKKLRFKKLVIKGERLESSTSSDPGHNVYIVKNLVKVKL